MKDSYSQFGTSLHRLILRVSPAWNKLWQARIEGQFLFAYLPANHLGKFEQPKEIGLVEIPILPSLKADLGSMFWKYLVFLRAKQANAFEKQDFPAHQAIKDWFSKIEGNLASLLEIPDLRLEYEFDKLTFWILEPGKEKYSLNELSDGFSAILKVVSEILMRMSKSGLEVFDMQGIVLIDEIESHLHIDLQKKILPFLTGLFPRIQFIVTTHSPFVLNSISNAVICDLEKRIVTKDLHAYSSEAIVESYFGSDKYSDELKEEFEEYKALMSMPTLKPEQLSRKRRLDPLFDSIPKYWSHELMLEVNRLRLKHR